MQLNKKWQECYCILKTECIQYYTQRQVKAKYEEESKEAKEVFDLVSPSIIFYFT